jgi:hypothetical protein
MRPRPSRRRLLALTVTAALAGCSDGKTGGNDDGGSDDGSDGGGAQGGGDNDEDGGAGGGDEKQDGSGDGGAGGDEEDAGGTATPEADDGLDLREANVVGVEFAAEGDAYGFDVTLHHDDDGEEGYANWWQVERLDGTRLGRRDLAHPHSTQPFTRPATVEVPEGVTCVVVRGHDETHGYGGRAMLVNPETGGKRAVAQGSEKRAFAESACP